MYIGQWHLSPLQSRHLGTSCSSSNCHQLPHHIFLNVTDDLKSLPFQRWRDLVLGKAGSHGVSNLGWVTWVIWCFAKKLCMRHAAWAGVVSWWSCQSPVAHSCGLLNHPNSFPGGMFKLNAKFDASSLLYFLGHFECNGHTVHMLTQWCLPPPLTSKVIIVHACALQPTLCGCQVIWMLHKLFSLD